MKLLPRIRAALRASPPYKVAMRMLVKLGQRQLPRILNTKPIETDAHGSPSSHACSVHIVTHETDWQLAMWAIKSFYWRACVRWPLMIHEGGTLGRVAREALHRHFPFARIVDADEANVIVETELDRRGLTTLLKARRECVLMRKIVDPALIEPTLRWLVFDSDVLFFRRPDELIGAGNSVRPLEHSIYLRDFISVYSIAPAIVREAFEVQLVEKVNTGLTMTEQSQLDLAGLECILSHKEIVHRIGTVPWLIEQTLLAIHGTIHGLRFWPDTYGCGTARGLCNTTGEQLKFKHYPAAPRPMFYAEGILKMIFDGALRGRG